MLFPDPTQFVLPIMADPCHCKRSRCRFLDFTSSWKERDALTLNYCKDRPIAQIFLIDIDSLIFQIIRFITKWRVWLVGAREQEQRN